MWVDMQGLKSDHCRGMIETLLSYQYQTGVGRKRDCFPADKKNLPDVTDGPRRKAPSFTLLNVTVSSSENYNNESV